MKLNIIFFIFNCKAKKKSLRITQIFLLELKIMNLKLFSILIYFNFRPSFKLRWRHARDLYGSQIPVTTRGFGMRTFCVRCTYVTHKLGNQIFYKSFTVQTLLWSLKSMFSNADFVKISSCFPDKFRGNLLRITPK